MLVFLIGIEYNIIVEIINFNKINYMQFLPLSIFQSICQLGIYLFTRNLTKKDQVFFSIE